MREKLNNIALGFLMFFTICMITSINSTLIEQEVPFWIYITILIFSITYANTRKL